MLAPTSGAAGVDTAGADGFGSPQVVGVAAGNNTSSPVSGGVGTVSGIAGSYGTLYLNADGTYTYDANPNAVTSNQTDTFIYTVQDGDGDLSTTTLTINVNNVSVTASEHRSPGQRSRPAERQRLRASSKPSTVRSPRRRHGSPTPTR